MVQNSPQKSLVMLTVGLEIRRRHIAAAQARHTAGTILLQPVLDRLQLLLHILHLRLQVA